MTNLSLTPQSVVQANCDRPHELWNLKRNLDSRLKRGEWKKVLRNWPLKSGREILGTEIEQTSHANREKNRSSQNSDYEQIAFVGPRKLKSSSHRIMNGPFDVRFHQRPLRKFSNLRSFEERGKIRLGNEIQFEPLRQPPSHSMQMLHLRYEKDIRQKTFMTPFQSRLMILGSLLGGYVTQICLRFHLDSKAKSMYV